MNVIMKNGKQAEVVIGNGFATVEGRKLMALVDNSIKVWNNDLLDANSTRAVKEEMKRLFVKNVVETNKKRK